jgi:transcriptional regulator with XRE-family HTH domain
MSKICEILGNNIRNLRKERKWTQEQLAEKADISVPYMTQIELGRKQASLDTVENIAKALSVSIDELFRSAPSSNKNINASLKSFESTLIKTLTSTVKQQFSNLRF